MSEKYNFPAWFYSILYQNHRNEWHPMSKAYTIGIIVFDGVLTAEVIGPAEVFGIANQRDDFRGAKVLLIGIENQPTIRTEEGIQLTVDATIADDLALD